MVPLLKKETQEGVGGKGRKLYLNNNKKNLKKKKKET